MDKLRAVPDFLTVHTNSILKRTRDLAEEVKAIVPMLSFIRGGAEFSVPLTHDALVQVGRDMSQTAVAVRAMLAMGPEFGIMAMHMAERSKDLHHFAHDQKHFLCEVGSILHLVGPQAFFLSAPVKLASGVFTPEQALELARKGPENPALSNAIMVTGRNVVRSYSVITPFVSDPQGHLYYEKAIVLDSMDGVPHQAQGPFASIYEPARN